MFCPTCGAANQLGPTCVTCKASLTSTGVPTPVMVVNARQTSSTAIAGFVLAFFCGLLGLIFSAQALSEIKRSNGTLAGEGLAQAGLVVSIISMLLGLAIVLGR